jgi:CRP/FNR family transcriptional regulator
MTKIAAAAELRSYDAGETIFAEGEPVTGVYCHCSGDVAIELGRDADRHEVGRSRPGDLLGYRGPEHNDHYIVTAVARSEVRLAFIELDAFTTMLTKSPHLMFNVMRSLSERIDGLEGRIFA